MSTHNICFHGEIRKKRSGFAADLGYGFNYVRCLQSVSNVILNI